MGGCRPCRSNRLGKDRGRFPWFEGLQGALPWSHQRVYGLGSVGRPTWVVNGCYRPPDEEEEGAEALFMQHKEASCLQAVVLTGGFTHPDVCWMGSTAGLQQCRRFLEYTNNLWTQVTEEQSKKKQDHSPGLQESRLQPVCIAAWKNPLGYSPGKKRAA